MLDAIPALGFCFRELFQDSTGILIPETRTFNYCANVAKKPAWESEGEPILLNGGVGLAISRIGEIQSVRVYRIRALAFHSPLYVPIQLYLKRSIVTDNSLQKMITRCGCVIVLLAG